MLRDWLLPPYLHCKMVVERSMVEQYYMSQRPHILHQTCLDHANGKLQNKSPTVASECKAQGHCSVLNHWSQTLLLIFKRAWAAIHRQFIFKRKKKNRSPPTELTKQKSDEDSIQNKITTKRKIIPSMSCDQKPYPTLEAVILK